MLLSSTIISELMILNSALPLSLFPQFTASNKTESTMVSSGAFIVLINNMEKNFIMGIRSDLNTILRENMSALMEAVFILKEIAEEDVLSQDNWNFTPQTMDTTLKTQFLKSSGPYLLINKQFKKILKSKNNDTFVLYFSSKK